jgi:hypothetical protein
VHVLAFTEPFGPMAMPARHGVRPLLLHLHDPTSDPVAAVRRDVAHLRTLLT